MAGFPFDAPRHIKRLREAGLSDAEARACTYAAQEAFDNAVASGLDDLQTATSLQLHLVAKIHKSISRLYALLAGFVFALAFVVLIA